MRLTQLALVAPLLAALASASPIGDQKRSPETDAAAVIAREPAKDSDDIWLWKKRKDTQKDSDDIWLWKKRDNAQKDSDDIWLWKKKRTQAQKDSDDIWLW